MLSPIRPVRREAAVSTNPQASLCGLRDLCAMLSPIRPVLARKPPVSTNPQAFLCGLRDLCAMLSPIRCSRTEATVSTNPQASLCGLRDLCAMLSPVCPVLARKPPCPPTLRPPSVAFVTSVRCFPRFAQFSHGSRPCPPTLRPSSVAFVTSVRCFPRFAQFSHGSHRVHQPSGLPL